jgi:hypothetical protein
MNADGGMGILKQQHEGQSGQLQRVNALWSLI